MLGETEQLADIAAAPGKAVTFTLKSTPDELEFDCTLGETVLEAALRAGLPIAHACGGHARCSTCRIWLLSQPPDEVSISAAETELKDRLRLGPDIRLACQLRPTGPLRFKRLVLDESDLEIANQLDRPRPVQVGETRNVAVMFFDVANFTAIANRMPPYDVMFLLNKFLAQANRVLERYGGYFDKTIGDGFVAIFGVQGGEAPALRAVAAALDILGAVERARPVVKRLYGIEFSGRIGLHYGEALIGALGPPGNDRLTVVGDVANIANRVEQANKDAGTVLLITEEMYGEVQDEVVSPDFLRVGMKGTEGRRTLYEVSALTPEAKERVERLAAMPFSDLPARRWVRLIASADLQEGKVVVLPQQRFDVALTRQDGRVFAFNNHCPHNKLSFFGMATPEGSPLPETPAQSSFPRPDRIACRFHESVFDLKTGGIISWCPALAEDGTVPGLEFLGDISKNEAPLEVFRCREFEEAIWVEL
jgi:class 3 adenylate cyclase/nitrite reductase/ring-hydroxylating ferredoxin subunit